ncbi:MAG: ABC transporter permease [Lachnospiraceae bacterium]|nr:ABC transporter permease [Lachnospiraceae bacterium]
MEKTKLLTASHFRKNKGTYVGLFLLMLLAAMLISSVLLLFIDVYPTVEREAERLNSGNGYLRFSKNISGIDDAALSRLMDGDVSGYEAYHCLCYSAVSVPFGDGNVVIDAQVTDSRVFDKQIARNEIILEDSSITGNYIYLPYQFYTSETRKLGDIYTMELMGRKYDLKVKGFFNTVYFGCNNAGTFEYIVDDATYRDIFARDGETMEGIVVTYALKDYVKQSKFIIRVCNELLSINADTIASSGTLDSAIRNRTFLSRIIAISFLAVSILVLIVIILMLVNSISNYVRENMQTIGALKAIGYTSGNIKASLLLMFGILAISGSILGVLLSYVLMPIVAKLVVIQMGVPYNISFNLLPSLGAFLFVVAYIMAVTALSVGKIRKIDPIIALKDGIKTHNFRKNRVRLDSSHFGLNTSLSFKTMFANMRQNVITFIVTGVIIFLCVIALLMYENFNRNPKLEMLTFEICSGVAAYDYEAKDEALEYLESRSDVSNIRRMIELYLYYNDEEKLRTYVYDDLSKLNNQDACYKGRLPKYDNEVAVSGKFAKEYGFKIGDEIRLDYGDENFSYLITGLIQTSNNNGKEAVLLEKGAERLIDFTYVPAYFYFDCADRDVCAKILDDCTGKFGNHLISTINFWDIIEGSLTELKGLASLMLILVCSISAAVILLILYLLIKSFLYGKRKDYGICKAIGYTSGNLIFQTALSFMPPIILSVIVCGAASYFAANPYMNIMMSSFGIVKASFDIPIPGLLLIGAGIIVVSFLFAIFEARRIRKMEAYKILISE